MPTPPPFTCAPAAKTGMLIRKPAAEVFEAFLNPDITTQFWFTRSSGRLEVGQPVQWDWEMYQFSTTVKATAIEPHQRIVLEWPRQQGAASTVEWIFTAPTPDSTFVNITHSGFVGGADEIVSQVADSTEGFSLVLAGLKALLEHGIRLNLVADRYPGGLDAR